MSALKSINPENFKWFDYGRYSFSLGLNLNNNLYLSGHSASEYDNNLKKIVVNGDIVQQTNTALDKIECILNAENKSLANVTNVVENITVKGLSHYEIYNSAIIERIPKNTNRQKVVVDSLLRPDAFIELEVMIEDQSNEASEEIVHLPTLIADSDISDSDLIAQTKNIYFKAKNLLEDLGFQLKDIVKTIDYITPKALNDYKYTGKIRKEHLGPVYPGATGILMSKVSDSGSLISINITAAKGQKIAINPGWERYKKLTYSPAVKCGTNLFMSGQAALDPETEAAVYAEDIYEQTKYTYSNIICVLEEAGLSEKNLIKTIEYVTPGGLSEYRSTANVRKELLTEPYPSSTGIICNSLLRKEFLIEIDPFAKYF